MSAEKKVYSKDFTINVSGVGGNATLDIDIAPNFKLSKVVLDRTVSGSSYSDWTLEIFEKITSLTTRERFVNKTGLTGLLSSVEDPVVPVDNQNDPRDNKFQIKITGTAGGAGTDTFVGRIYYTTD